jgi:hypothetical protein
MERIPSKQTESIDPAEQARITVERFINFTKKVLSKESQSIDVEWEHQMNMLYGDPELAQLTKYTPYEGVKIPYEDNDGNIKEMKVQQALEEAYQVARILGVMSAFEDLASIYTDIDKMGAIKDTAISKIANFK